MHGFKATTFTSSADPEYQSALFYYKESDIISKNLKFKAVKAEAAASNLIAQTDARSRTGSSEDGSEGLQKSK